MSLTKIINNAPKILQFLPIPIVGDTLAIIRSNQVVPREKYFENSQMDFCGIYNRSRKFSVLARTGLIRTATYLTTAGILGYGSIIYQELSKI